MPQSLPHSSPESVPQSLRYRRAAVRDLAWLVLDGALGLPPGMQPLATVRLSACERAEFLELLQQWDESADDAWLGSVDPHLRLGLYSERLLGAWLSQSKQIRLLAMNWPLRADRITLGEADFLVERNIEGADQRQLWETACKFYLGVPGRGWLGPGLNDSLASKLARVRGHQLQLIHQAGFTSAWGSDWSARALMAGWLLRPATLLRTGAPVLPSRPSSRSRIPAVWVEAGSSSLTVAAQHGRQLGVTQWWLLPKRRWLRPVYNDEPVEAVFASLADAAAFLTSAANRAVGVTPAGAEAGGTARRRASEKGPRPLMLAGVRWSDKGDAGAGCSIGMVAAEAIRLMLVPPGWTLRALAMAPQLDSLAESSGDYLTA